MSEEHDPGVVQEVDPDEPYDAGDRRAVKRRETIAKRRDASDRMVLRQLMGSSEGRAWVRKMLAMCHIHQTTFHMNARAAAFAEGERNVGLRLEADIIGACPDRYMEMLKEVEDGS